MTALAKLIHAAFAASLALGSIVCIGSLSVAFIYARWVDARDRRGY